MSEYQLQIKQIVDYPRCRIYRQFGHTLMEDRSFRVSEGAGLFHCVTVKINHLLCRWREYLQIKATPVLK